jgi:hypothetical protein
MDIEYVDSKVPTKQLYTLSLGDVFTIPDGFNDVCMYLGYDHQNNLYEYVILGEYPEKTFVEEKEKDLLVRELKAKLVVEI